MTYPCMTEGCTREATKQLRLTLHARGYPISPRTTIDSIFGLMCCDGHATKEAGDGVIKYRPAQERLEEVYKQQGLALPDWETSFAWWGPIVGQPAQIARSGGSVQ